MGEVQIKATLRNHYTPTRTAQIKRAAPRSSDQDAEQLGPSPTAGRMHNGRVWQFLSKLNMQLPCHLASELLGMSPTDTQKFCKTGTQLIAAALFITAPAGEQPSCPLAGEGLNRAWDSRTLEYYSAVKGADYRETCTLVESPENYTK